MCHASSEDRMLMPRTNKDGKPLPTRALQIINDHEGQDGSVEHTAWEALSSASYPILLSKKLFDKILFKEKTDSEQLTKDLLKKIDEERYQRYDEASRIWIRAYCQTLFDEKAWSIYQPNNNFVLLIPHSYTQAIGAQALSSKDLDLAHGLQLSTMPKVNLDDLKQSSLFDNNSEGYNFCHIFVENKIYEKSDMLAKQKPQWVLLMDGHGTYGKDILGMSIVEFQTKVIPFFTQSITTKLLAYDSCYANGSNASLIYNDGMDNGKPKQLPFVITSCGIYDFPVYNKRLISITQGEKKIPVIGFVRDSKNFFESAVSTDPAKLVNLLSFIYQSLQHRNLSGSNAIFIRYPNEQKFSPLLRSLILGPEEKDNKEIKDNLDLKKALEDNKTEDPHYVFLTTPTIKTPILINTEIFKICSMITGTITHTFSHVICKIPLKTLRKRCVTHPENIELEKNFFIKQLSINDTKFFDVLFTEKLVEDTKQEVILGKKDGDSTTIFNLEGYESSLLQLYPLPDSSLVAAQYIKITEQVQKSAISAPSVQPNTPHHPTIANEITDSYPSSLNLASSRATTPPPLSPRVLSMPITSSAPSILPHNQTALSLPLPNTPYHPTIANNNDSYSSLLIAGASIVAGTAVYQYFKKSTKKKKKSKKYQHQALK